MTASQFVPNGLTLPGPGKSSGASLIPLSANLFLVLAILISSTTELAAHPIDPKHRDRMVVVRLTESAILVEYVLALDKWTLTNDLQAVSGDIDFAGDHREAYAKVYGPRIGRDLMVKLDGRSLRLTLTRFELNVEDHVRYTFHYQAPLQVGSNGPTHHLHIFDSNFTWEPGLFHMDIQSTGQVKLEQVIPPKGLARGQAIKLHEFDLDEHERLRTLEALFALPAISEASPPELESETVVVAQPTLWELVRSFSLVDLLNSGFGLLLLTVLAFFFGTVHALQPGHGKTLVAAYLVGEHGTIGHALFLGLVTTLTHTSMVIVLAVVGLFVPEVAPNVTFLLSLSCGMLVVLMAFWLLLKRVGGQADHVHLFGGHHHHDGGHEHHHHGTVGWGALVSLGVTGGLVPCFDAWVLLALAWVVGQPGTGLVLILSFSLGLASVLVLIGVLVVKLKRFAGSRWGEGRLVRSLPIASALLTLALGIWMCREALHQRDQLASSQGKPAASQR